MDYTTHCQRERPGTAHKKTHAAFYVLTWRDWETWHVPTSMPKQIAVENGRSHSPRISQNPQSMRFLGRATLRLKPLKLMKLSCNVSDSWLSSAPENLSKNGGQLNVCKNFEAFCLKINVNTSIFQTPNLLPFAKVTSLVWNEVASGFKLIDAAHSRKKMHRKETPSFSVKDYFPASYYLGK